jgi:hypothetical protein
MSRLTWLERAAMLGLLAQQVYIYLVLPESPFAHLGQPVYLAALASTVTTVSLIALRFGKPRRARLEQFFLASFLAGMPVIYAWTALAAGVPVGVEVVGLVIYCALALAGWYLSPWFLAAGIAAHGLAWDSWHHGGLVVPSWYAIGCLVVDVALAAWVATQVPAYRAAAAR